MNVIINPSMSIDADLLTEQRALIGTLIGSLTNGRTGFAIKRDLTTLFGIQGILDAVADSVDFTSPADDATIADLAHQTVEGWDLGGVMESAEQALIDFWSSPEGADDLGRCIEEHGEPECPGCTTQDLCEDCEYQYDTDLDPTCDD